MEFLHLYYKEYPAKDGGDLGPKSYPYAVQIPDRDERIAFGKMLEENGFKRVVYENGNNVILVNFTLMRFGNIPKAAKTRCLNPEGYLSREAFMEQLYLPFKNNENARQILSDNYLQSAALSIVEDIDNLRINADRYDENYLSFMNASIGDALRVIREPGVTAPEQKNDNKEY